MDHVPVTYSEYAVPGNGATFDYFHGNSIALTSDGNLLISARNTSAVYDVNHTTGAVIWELGGSTPVSPWRYPASSGSATSTTRASRRRM
jgi:outer membrane protein assembly factor BamB